MQLKVVAWNVGEISVRKSIILLVINRCVRAHTHTHTHTHTHIYSPTSFRRRLRFLENQYLVSPKTFVKHKFDILNCVSC